MTLNVTLSAPLSWMHDTVNDAVDDAVKKSAGQLRGEMDEYYWRTLAEIHCRAFAQRLQDREKSLASETKV